MTAATSGLRRRRGLCSSSSRQLFLHLPESFTCSNKVASTVFFSADDRRVHPACFFHDSRRSKVSVVLSIRSSSALQILFFSYQKGVVGKAYCSTDKVQKAFLFANSFVSGSLDARCRRTGHVVTLKCRSSQLSTEFK